MKAIVTGASPGIGGAVALRLAADCAARGERLDIVLTASGAKPAPQALLDELAAGGARTLFLTGDLADAELCRDLARRTLDFLDGGLDTFVSNAGGPSGAPLGELTLDRWDRAFAVNVRPTFILAQAFRPALAASRGTIVAVASMSGLRPHPGLGAYSAAKAALIMLCRQLAQEWAADGIRVNAVAPGLIRTPLSETVYRDPQVKQAREALVPLGRIGTAEDIAGVVAFLAGPASAYVTGEVLLADGGIADSTLGTIPGRPARD